MPDEPALDRRHCDGVAGLTSTPRSSLLPQPYKAHTHSIYEATHRATVQWSAHPGARPRRQYVKGLQQLETGHHLGCNSSSQPLPNNNIVSVGVSQRGYTTIPATMSRAAARATVTLRVGDVARMTASGCRFRWRGGELAAFAARSGASVHTAGVHTTSDMPLFCARGWWDVIHVVRPLSVSFDVCT